MLEEMTVDDRNASYAETYCLLESDNLSTLTTVRIQHFTSEDEAVVIDIEGMEYRVGINRLRLVNSDLGMFRHSDNSIYYVARVAQRQWRRGLRNSTLFSYKLSEDGSIRPVSVPSIFCMAIASHFLPPNRELGEGVINRDFAVVGDILWFRTLPVGGVVSHTDKIIKPKTKLKLPDLEGWSYEYSE